MITVWGGVFIVEEDGRVWEEEEGTLLPRIGTDPPAQPPTDISTD